MQVTRQRFALFLSNLLAVVLVAEVVAAAAVPFLTWVARQDIDGLELFWKNRRESVYEVRALEFDLIALRDVQYELDGWRKSRLAWGDLVGRIQSAYPTNVGLGRLTMRGQIEQRFEKAEARAHPEAIPYRTFYLQMEGVALGVGVAGRVAEFTSSLEKDPVMQAVFPSLQLQGILKKEDRTEFSLQANSQPRSMQ